MSKTSHITGFRISGGLRLVQHWLNSNCSEFVDEERKIQQHPVLMVYWCESDYSDSGLKIKACPYTNHQLRRC